jgi:cytochrome c
VRLAAIGVVGLVLVAALALAGCTGETTPRSPYRVAMGDPSSGRLAISQFGCGACHTIPGVRGAEGMVGPPLIAWSRRTYIAGQVPNTPANLVLWLRNPQAVEDGTAMPVLGLDERQARDVAAYLYSLR